MRLSFLPRWITDSVTDISPAFLKSKGITLLMLDFDNTLVPYTTDVPTESVLDWLRQMQQQEIRLCVVSNSHKARVKIFCKQYGISCITHAKKPFSKGICQCLEQFSVKPSECALAGDQIFTDTLGANLTGISPILVKAIHNHTIWLKLRHIAELPFIFIARKRRIDHEKH